MVATVPLLFGVLSSLIKKVEQKRETQKYGGEIVMKKKIFQCCCLVFVILLFLTGCGTNSYNGESQNWLGSYNGYEEYKN